MGDVLMCKLYEYDYHGLSHGHGHGGLAGQKLCGIVDQSMDGLYSLLLNL